MLKSDSELQFLFPFRLSNRFVCARGSAKARFPPINGWIFVFRVLKDRYPPSELFNDKGGCASFSFSMNEKPGDLNYSRLLI